MIRVFLIRHGESESNAGLPSADPGSAPLTPDGHRQARRIAQVLADVPALIVSSPYLRARQTAQPTISRFPQAACQQWPVQEFTYLGDLHGRTSTAAERQPYAQAYWDQADPHHASPGAESFTGLLRRTAGFLDLLSAQRSGPVVVFTHGLFMRTVAWSLLTGITIPGQDQMRSFRRFANHYLIPNAGVIELRQADNDAPALLGGSTIHLPAASGGRRPDREHQRYRLGQQAARDESEDLGRGLVEPLRIVRDAQNRPLLGGLRQEAERRQGDQEPVRAISGGEPQRDAERATLRLGQRPEPAEHRRAQLVQPRVGEFHLRLDAGHAGHPETGHLGDQLPQQFRLADPRLSPDDQDGTAASSHVRDEPSQDLQLGGPAEQPGRRHVTPTIRSEE